MSEHHWASSRKTCALLGNPDETLCFVGSSYFNSLSLSPCSFFRRKVAASDVKISAFLSSLLSCRKKKKSIFNAEEKTNSPFPQEARHQSLKLIYSSQWSTTLLKGKLNASKPSTLRGGSNLLSCAVGPGQTLTWANKWLLCKKVKEDQPIWGFLSHVNSV